jgi:hypothetical protein
VYVIRGESDSEWVSPAPAEEVIVEALVTDSDVIPEDIYDVSTYVDTDELATVVNGDGETLTFTVEGHEITVTSDGDVTVGE